MTLPHPHQLRDSLTNARFEVLPVRGLADKLGELPVGSTVTVTCSEAKGIETTVRTAADLAKRGFHVVPHLAARQVRDSGHLTSLLDELDEAGLREVFVVAGDSPNPGEFPDALALLRGMSELSRLPEKIGITGYPEGHAYFSDEQLITAMSEKAPYASYIVSQICYDPVTIAAWVKSVRARGILQPIYIGVPGVVDATKLLRMSLKIGLGESLRFLRKQHSMLSKLLTRYTPDELFDELGPYLLDQANGIAGWHLFTFNEVAKTHQWRTERAHRLQEVPA